MRFKERFYRRGDETGGAGKLCWQRLVWVGLPREQGRVA